MHPKGLRRGRRPAADERAATSGRSATSPPRPCSSRTSPSPRASPWPSASPGIDVAPIDYVNIPRVTYSSPEIASVGLTEAQARDAGHEVVIEKLDLRAIGKANIVGEGGFVKVVAEVDDGPVLGVHMIGPHVTDLIAEAMLITSWEASAARRCGAHPPAPLVVRRPGRGDARARRQSPAHRLRRTVATTFEPDAAADERPLPDEQLRDMLYLLKLARYVDERLEALYRQGRLPGALYSGRGQEGTHVGRGVRLGGRRLAVPHPPRSHGAAREGSRPRSGAGAVLGPHRRLSPRARRQQPHRRLGRATAPSR